MKKFLQTPLVQNDPQSGWPLWKKAVFWLWNAGLLTLFALLAGVMALRLAYGHYDPAFFGAYFTVPGLLWRNLLPPLLLILLLWLLLRRTWLAFLLGGLVTLGFPAANYYVLQFRDDPLTPELLNYLREAVMISTTSGYDLTPDGTLLLALALLAGGTVILALLTRGRPRRALFWVPVICLLLLEAPLRDGNYYENAYDPAVTDGFSVTESYIARGFWYPFLHQLMGAQNVPEVELFPLLPGEASGEEAVVPAEPTLADYLEGYTDSDIPEERKIDLLVFQREAYADFSVYDIEGMDWSCYDLYHAIRDESYHGTLVTNIFSGGTIDTERCVLTGLWDVSALPSEGNLNSYAWYFKDQGYTVEGAHPCFNWFYDRLTVNPRFGFERYLYSEDTFSALSGWTVAYDDIFLPVVWDMYQEKTADGTPYFGFHVTYEGHGPYIEEYIDWAGANYSDAIFTGKLRSIFNNYLGILHDCDVHLTALLDQLRESERPVAVVLYGDHKPWLGNEREVYEALGISLEMSTEEGFYNYSNTEYLLWINPAAEAVLGKEIRGEGPTISPCYLMNVVFEQLGWEGTAFSKKMDEYRQVMPVITTTGRFLIDGQLVTRVPAQHMEMATEFRKLHNLWKTQQLY